MRTPSRETMLSLTGLTRFSSTKAAISGDSSEGSTARGMDTPGITPLAGIVRFAFVIASTARSTVCSAACTTESMTLGCGGTTSRGVPSDGEASSTSAGCASSGTLITWKLVRGAGATGGTGAGATGGGGAICETAMGFSGMASPSLSQNVILKSSIVSCDMRLSTLPTSSTSSSSSIHTPLDPPRPASGSSPAFIARNGTTCPGIHLPVNGSADSSFGMRTSSRGSKMASVILLAPAPLRMKSVALL
mmetsp:Transcript_5496/g.14287  ORF Transcript_5496/g.14287 Transcript_5496/m.14287 type:complete len:248 (-) Transcript_5496:588-1331(-)